MSQQGRPQETRQPDPSPRWLEVLAGAPLLLFALVLCPGALMASWWLASGSWAGRDDWRMWAGVFAMSLVGSWCAQTSWRLFTGRERKSGGLLSPLVLMLFAAGSVAASIASGLHDVMNLAWVRFMGLGLGCFSFALYRLQRRKRRAPA